MTKNDVLRTAVALAVGSMIAMPAAHAQDYVDFGDFVEQKLEQFALGRFGWDNPLEAPATMDDVVDRNVATAQERQLLAGDLKAEFVTRSLANLGDMIAFWPNDLQYSHLIICIEQGRSGTTPAGNDGLNAAIQRVNVLTGQVDTILHGMDRCDGIRTTPWGTILATEETDDGAAYEIVNPLSTNGHWIADRATGDVRTAIDGDETSERVVKRDALPIMSWEGLTVLRNGVVYAGDELRPGSGTLDSDGGAIFKFVPASPYLCGAPILGSQTGEGGVCVNRIDDLAESPLVSGSVYAYTASCQNRGSSSFPQYGQGCEIGEGAWVKVDAATARADANANGATGYYRPEDLHRDRATGDGMPDQPNAHFCWTNTGNDGAKNFAETVCMLDENMLGDSTKIDTRTGLEYLGDSTQPRGYAVATANRLVEGNPRFNSHDNLDIQPVSGNVYVIEDDQFGEIWGCLPDGVDTDVKSDGCLAMLSVRDPEAEPTGFIFDGTGKVAYYIIQHGQQFDELLDFESNPVDGTTDDLMKITGFRLRTP